MFVQSTSTLHDLSIYLVVLSPGNFLLIGKKHYSCPPLSALLVTHCPPQSENITWKVPEINNS